MVLNQTNLAGLPSLKASNWKSGNYQELRAIAEDVPLYGGTFFCLFFGKMCLSIETMYYFCAQIDSLIKFNNYEEIFPRLNGSAGFLILAESPAVRFDDTSQQKRNP